MAVTNANTGSDLQALDRMFIQKTLEGMLFSVPGLTKTRRSRGPKEVRYSKFVFDARICPVNILSLYLKITEALYPVGQQQPLFVAVKRPSSQDSHNSYHLQIAEGDSV